MTLELYRLTSRFPAEERYGLTSQLRRAAVSVAANIAEGSMKTGGGEYRRFTGIAIGSLAEVEYLLRLAIDLGYLTVPEAQGAIGLRARTGRLLFGLYRALGGVRSPATPSP